ncbi:hypothetical protein BDV93DRAFT_608421 [Ceratobasidium sp. AG-I]|nr:hypothetical protein BDV93DRAFT_608421 [Ceratobasidium sp. AG-I]
MSIEHLFAAAEQRDVQSKSLFAELKPVCTTLLRQTLITPSTASTTTSTLADLVRILRNATHAALTPSLIQYIFFPLSHLLRRNNIAALPNHLLERIFQALALLAGTWYWTCEPEVWEQLVMLASAVLAGLDATKRDEETYLAAARTLRALVRSPDPDPDSELEFDAQARFDVLVHRAQSPRTLPVLGKSLDALLAHASSPNVDLQRTALEVLLVLVRDYFPDAHVPSVIPGVTSAMCRVALDTQKAPAISGALEVLRALIVRGMSDEVCIRHGALRDIRTLDDLLDPTPDSDSESTEPASETTPKVPIIPRTPSWLAATASQVHIALNALSPLASHPNPTARSALVHLSADILRATPRALPQSQPLLLSTLLILAHPALPLQSNTAPPPPDALASLSTLRSLLPEHLSTLTSLTSQMLSAFPHRLTRRTALILTTSCALLPAQSVGALLGPGGGIHKWGYTLLRVLKFESPGVVVMSDPAKLIQPPSSSAIPEAEATGGEMEYPRLVLQTLDEGAGLYVEEMFTCMGGAAHDGGMYAVEWFVGVARTGGGDGRVDEVQVAALWCALMILRGAVAKGESARIGKCARWVARSVAELWDDDSLSVVGEGRGEREEGGEEVGSRVQTLEVVEHIKGLNPLTTLLDRPGLGTSGNASRSGRPTPKRQFDLQTQHTSLSLQLLSTSHIALSSLPSSHTTSTTPSIIQPTNPSTTLLQQTLYPLLHALLSPSPLVSSTAHTALSQVSHTLGYATPSNMLLANFDYALESVAGRVQSFSSYAAYSSASGGRAFGAGAGEGTEGGRLNAPSLSIQALHVLRALVRLVGRAIIDRAYDVLDECFDRLDEYHGYSAVVQALVEVLGEVVDAVGREDEGNAREGEREDVGEVVETEEERWEGFVEWFKHRKDPKEEEEWSFDPPKPEDDPDAEPKNPDPEPNPDSDAPPPLPPSQSLTRHIIARSTYFLTHSSPIIRTRILHLLTSAAPTLRASALLPTINAAWPFILNRLDDKEHYVVLAAAGLIEALSKAVGDFMARRVWDDIWPRFSRILSSSAPASSSSTALIPNRNQNRVQLNTDAYGPLARSKLHLSILHTLTSAVQHIEPRDDALWGVLLACRRFLRSEEGEDVQGAAREMYRCVGERNGDAVWLVLTGLCGGDPRMEVAEGDEVNGGGESGVRWDKVEMPKFLREDRWDVRTNVISILNTID